MKNLNLALKNIDIYPASPRIVSFPPIWTGVSENSKLSQFIYCLEGGFVCTVGSNNYLVNAGQMVLTPQGVPHACWALPGIPPKCIFFVFRALSDGKDIFTHLGMTEDNHVVSLPKEAVLNCCSSITDSPLSAETVPYYLILSAQLSTIIAMYVKARVSAENVTSVFHDEIAFMKAHISEDVSLTELAALSHLHPDYFSRKFKEIVGISPIRYFAEMRASHAANLLLTTTMSTEQVSKAVGFSSVYYFASFFKKHIGIRPEAYKKVFQPPVALCEKKGERAARK